MNKKQRVVLLLTVLIVVLIFVFGPKYKIVKIGNHGNDYIKTKSGSSLYKRSKGPMRFEWLIIAKMLLPVAIISPLLILALREKRVKETDAAR